MSAVPMSIGFVELLILLGLGGGLGLPLGIPPEPPDPVVARIAPDDCLFYVTWSGTAKPDPKSPNQTEQLLAEPEIQRLVTQLEPRIRAILARATARQGDARRQQLAEDAARLAWILLTHPAALYVADVRVQPGGPPEVRAGLVARVGEDAGEVGQRIKHHLDSLLPGAAKDVGTADVVAYQLKPGPRAPVITWGVRGKYLFVTVGQGEAEALAGRNKTPAPEWLTTAAKAVAVERPANLSYLNTKRIVNLLAEHAGPQARTVIDMIGLDNVEFVASMSGLSKEGFESRTLLRIDGPPKGIFALAPEQGLRPADLDPIPADATVAVAARIEADRILPAVRKAVERLGPSAQRNLEQWLGQFEQQVGIRPQEDILQTLGPSCCLYNSPGEGGLLITGATAVIEVKDPQRLGAALEKLVTFARAALARGHRSDRADRPRPKLQQFDFADHQIHFVNATTPGFPLAPAWCLADDQLIIATFPQNIKAYLSRDPKRPSLAANPRVAAALGAEGTPIKLVYRDTPRLFQMFYPMVPFFAQAATSQMARAGIDVDISLLPSARAIGPHLRPAVMTVRRTQWGLEVVNQKTMPGGNFAATAPVMTGLLLPAVTSARAAARRTQSMNNMKQIGLAILNYESAHRSLPGAYIADPEGKPLLSWRVAVLPYIEQAGLYEQFHLDEPWDSPHNKRLLGRMPKVYASPGSHLARHEGKTNYLTVRAPKSVFSGKEGVKLRQIVDGTSRTVMTVEVDDTLAVPWTKPDDFSLDPKDPARGLGGLRRGGFIVGFVDGSVRFVSKSIDRATLRGLFLYNDGQPVGPIRY